MAQTYLDFAGLQHYDQKLKASLANPTHSYTVAQNAAKNWYRLANAVGSQIDTSKPLHVQFLVTAWNSGADTGYYLQWFVDCQVFGRHAGIRIFGNSGAPFSQIRVLYENTIADIDANDRPAIDLYLNYVLANAATNVKVEEIYNSGWTFVADGALAASTVPTGFENVASAPSNSGIGRAANSTYADYAALQRSDITANAALADSTTYRGRLLNCTNAITLTLPSINSVWCWFIIKNFNAIGSGKNVTIHPSTTSVLIDGSNADIVLAPGEYVLLHSRAANSYTRLMDGRTYKGATASVAGREGLVPAPTIADKDKFLKGDGTWETALSEVSGSFTCNTWYVSTGYTYFDGGDFSHGITLNEAIPFSFNDEFTISADVINSNTLAGYSTITREIIICNVPLNVITGSYNGFPTAKYQTTTEYSNAEYAAYKYNTLDRRYIQGQFVDTPFISTDTWNSATIGDLIDIDLNWQQYGFGYYANGVLNEITQNNTWNNIDKNTIPFKIFVKKTSAEYPTSGTVTCVIKRRSGIEIPNISKPKLTLVGTLSDGTEISNNVDMSSIVSIIPESPSDYQGATSSSNGTAGLVPAATSAQRENFLRGDGTWATVSTAKEMAVKTVEPTASNTTALDNESIIFYDSGSAANAPQPVFTSGNQTIGGVKTFSAGIFSGKQVMSGTTMDCAAASCFTKTVTGNTTFFFTNVPSDAVCCVTLVLTNGGNYTVTWPSSVKWTGNLPPELTINGTDVLTFLTCTGGNVWYGTTTCIGVTA